MKPASATTEASAAPVAEANSKTDSSLPSPVEGPQFEEATTTDTNETNQTAPTVSLYVGELAPDVSEAHLFEVFNPIGTVASIRVCRDINTRRSLGYAYVNFHQSADAERALVTMNYSPIRGKPCRIMWSQRDPSLRRSGSGNVFIKNLSKEIDNKALADTFGIFGKILSCKINEAASGSKNFGFIHFETKSAADAAIENVNGKLLCGQPVYVGPFLTKNVRVTSSEEPKYNNLYIKNLEAKVDEAMLKEKFEKYGPIISCVIQKNAEGVSKGVGFVCYETPEDALKAVEDLNEKEWEGKELYVGRAQKKSHRQVELRNKFLLDKQNSPQGINLYVKNLDDDFDDEKLRNIFSAFGTITSAKVMKDEKGISKGFGFVCFSFPEEASRAVAELNGQKLGVKPLYVAIHQRKEERQAELSAQFSQRMNADPMYGMGARGPIEGPNPNMMYNPNAMIDQPRWAMPPRGAQGFGGPMMNAGYMGMQQGQGRGMSGPQGMRNMGGPHRGHISMRGRGGMHQRSQRHAGVGIRNGQSQQPPPLQPYNPNAPLNTSMLASAPLEQQKQMLGERLFTLIKQLHSKDVEKITGMLLEMDNSELLHLIEAPEALSSKVMEAVSVLESHRSTQESNESEAVNEVTEKLNETTLDK